MAPHAVIDLMAALKKSLAESHPSLSRGVVWCVTCRRSQKVNSCECIASGWPKCCGQTMTIDSPAERARLKAARVTEES